VRVLLQKSKIFDKTVGFLIRCEKTNLRFVKKNTSSSFKKNAVFFVQFKTLPKVGFWYRRILKSKAVKNLRFLNWQI
jgi:hypothetical protein